MLVSIGPISGLAELVQWDYSPVNTTGGILEFNDGVCDATYTATVVPIPGAVLLGAVGTGMVTWLRRRKTL